MKHKIKERLLQVIRENFEDQIDECEGIFDAETFMQENLQFVDLGFDSLLMMMLFTIIEEEFDIIFEDEDLTLDFEKIDNLVEFISSKLNDSE